MACFTDTYIYSKNTKTSKELVNIGLMVGVTSREKGEFSGEEPPRASSVFAIVYF